MIKILSESSFVTSHFYEIKQQERQYDEIRKEMMAGDNTEVNDHKRLDDKPGNNVIPSNEESQSIETSDSPQKKVLLKQKF